MIIGRSSVFYTDRKSKMAATTGHSINTGPYWENTEISSSLKLLHWLNLNYASIIGRVLYKLCVFYVDRNSKMTTTAGHSFYIGPIGFFYNQVNDTGFWEPLGLGLLWCNHDQLKGICRDGFLIISSTSITLHFLNKKHYLQTCHQNKKIHHHNDYVTAICIPKDAFLM